MDDVYRQTHFIPAANDKSNDGDVQNPFRIWRTAPKCEINVHYIILEKKTKMQPSPIFHYYLLGHQNHCVL